MRTTFFLFASAAVLALVGCDGTTRTSSNPRPLPPPSSSSTAVPSAAGTSDAPAVNSATPPGKASERAPASTDTPASAGPTTALKPVLPDNTAVNERDRAPAAKTPIDQNENQRDVNITAEIRKQILAHENMSVIARNVKVITADGKVTLRGPVNSAEEKDVIDGIAKKVAGKENVDNQIEVKESDK